MHSRPEATAFPWDQKEPVAISGRRKGLAKKIDSAVSNYISEVQSLGLVSRLILGIENDDVAHIISVFQTDTRPEDAVDPAYARLTELGGRLEQALAPHLRAYVSYLNPSRLSDLQVFCREHNIDTTQIEL